MDVLRRSGKETRYGGKEIIPGTKFGLKYNSARRRTQEMPTTSEERRPLADIGNITHLSSQTHASTYEDEFSRFIKDQDEVEVEEQVTKASKNILKKRKESAKY
nr:uncharacterized protein LOC123768258 [Procambarus clarkii]